MEEPSHTQRREAAIEAAVMLLVSGRHVPTVTAEMRKREIPAEEFEAIWPEIEARAKEKIAARHRRVRLAGWCWFGFGAAVLLGFVWVLAVRREVSIPLLVGAAPLAYGLRLVRSTPSREPEINPPPFFTNACNH